MSDVAAIFARCQAAGLRLHRDGDRIAIKPARLCPPELLAEIRALKTALLDLLDAQTANLPADCTPWLPTARQIMAGEFDNGDRSLLGSLLIGLRNIPHPACQQARARLETMLGIQWKKARP